MGDAGWSGGLLISISGEDCIGSTNASPGIDTVLAPCLKKASESAPSNFESPNEKSESAREEAREGGRVRCSLLMFGSERLL